MASPLAESAAPGPLRTLASSLTNDIRNDIIGGHLPPGSKLRLRELEARYGAGTIPLREALCRLMTSGFVVAEDQKGFRVSQVSQAELQDITDARVFIECEALRRSIRLGQLDWEERVVGAHFRVGRLPMVAPDSRALDPQWERAHEDFHSALLSACGSNCLLSMAEQLRDQSTRYRHLSIRVGPRSGAAAPRDVAAEHRALFDAALARDESAGAALLERHIRATTALVLLQSDAITAA